ncbi:hypothetical protein QVD99_001938 [Batrachochytrium dendrobatidis]|nr:hypothetical protein O5D80_000582 [Batrachochytrium dendrobatidis]KAK5672132.1 hypothetical protein QVD99_001938 [Batrachochytrium dendrobatidis]
MSLFRLTVDKSEYAPGDVVNFVCWLNNKDTLQAIKLVADLSMSERFHIAGAAQGLANPDNLAEPPPVQFFNSTIIQSIPLWRTQNKKLGTEFTAQPRSFRAQFVVPIDAVPSVVLTDFFKAQIKYVIKVELFLAAGRGKALPAEIAFNVVRSMPLINPPLVMPGLPKDFTSFDVEASLGLEQSMYSIGQDIQLQIQISNADKRGIKGIKVTLEEVRNGHFLAEHGRTNILASESIDCMIGTQQSKSFKVLLHPGNVTKFIAPSTFSGCVQVEHFIRIYIIPNKIFTSGIMFSVPIEIVGAQRL